jgi:hypothetical protein
MQWIERNRSMLGFHFTTFALIGEDWSDGKREFTKPVFPMDTELVAVDGSIVRACSACGTMLLTCDPVQRDGELLHQAVLRVGQNFVAEYFELKLAMGLRTDL